MSTAAVRSDAAARAARVGKVDMKLEVVAIPVADVDRAKGFYQRLGWRLDADFTQGGEHVLQFTPTGSQCSIHFGTNLTAASPGSAQSFLIVSDIQAARDELAGRAVQVSEVYHYAGFNRIDPNGRLSGPAPDRQSYGSFLVQRPGWQRLAGAGDHDATAGARHRRHDVPNPRRPVPGPAAGRGRARRAREAHGGAGRRLAFVVRRVHDRGAGRHGAADLRFSSAA
jgi:catechol 2,3-dioxygenase-like lactoylglutathione lyase family enzyme